MCDECMQWPVVGCNCACRGCSHNRPDDWPPPDGVIIDGTFLFDSEGSTEVPAESEVSRDSPTDDDASNNSGSERRVARRLEGSDQECQSGIELWGFIPRSEAQTVMSANTRLAADGRAYYRRPRQVQAIRLPIGVWTIVLGFLLATAEGAPADVMVPAPGSVSNVIFTAPLFLITWLYENVEWPIFAVALGSFFMPSTCYGR